MFSSTTYQKRSPAWEETPPTEKKNSLIWGLFAHLGPLLAFCVLTQLFDFEPLPTTLTFFVFAFLNLFQILWFESKAPSVELPPLKQMDIVYGMSFVFLKGIVLGGLVVAFSWWMCQKLLPMTIHLNVWLAIWLSVAGADLYYYCIHRFFNHANKSGNRLVRWFMKNHAEHHSVEALDFFRGNHSSVMDTSITGFQMPVAIFGAIFGLSLTQVLVAYAIIMFLQATHHVNYTFNIGWLRYIFVDNHNHKLHHCPRGNLVNYGAIFSIWDRLLGTCYENWDLSSNYLEKNRMALPIQRHSQHKQKNKKASSGVPSEQQGSIWFGCLGHFGPGLAVLIAAAFASDSPLLLLITFFAASGLIIPLILWAEKKDPCVDLPPASLKDNAKGMAHVFLTAIVAGSVVVIAGWWLLQQLPFSSPIHLPPFGSILAAVVLADLFYYWLHRHLNHGRMKNPLHRWFRKNHLEHHSVVSLDFMRGSLSSFADTALTGFQAPVLCASAILGMDLIPTLVAYSLLLILESTHHVNHTFNIGWLRYLFIDNHAHKMHHCPGGHYINQGVIFSLWDRLFGTYYENKNISPSYMQKYKIPLPLPAKFERPKITCEPTS